MSMIENHSNFTNSSEDDYIHTYTDEVIRAVYSTFLIAIFLLGVFGNSLTILVLHDKRLSQSSTSVYLTALAIVDLLYLLTSLLSNIINYAIIFPSELRNLFIAVCHCSPFFNYIFSHLSVWLMVSVTLDRAIWVTQPIKAKLICTKRHARIIVIILTITFIALDSHFFWTLRYVRLVDNNNNNNSSKFACEPNYFSRNIFPYIDLLLLVCIPFMIMLIANILIGWQLKKLRKITKRRHAKNRLLTSSTNVDETNSQGITEASLIRKERKQHIHDVRDSLKVKSTNDKSSSLTAMLIAVSVFFMVSVSPLMIYDIVFFAVDLTHWMDIHDTWGWTSTIYGIECTVYTFWYTNFSVHFFLYCLNGPQFRARALSIFRMAWGWRSSASESVENNRPTRTQLTTSGQKTAHNALVGLKKITTHNANDKHCGNRSNCENTPEGNPLECRNLPVHTASTQQNES